MKIIKKSAELTTRETFELTMSPAVKKMRDAESQILEIKNWALYQDTNSKDEMQEILAIGTLEGEVYATNSKTFTDDFIRMVELFEDNGEKVEALTVISGTSKAGRKFITCTIA